MPLDLLSGHLFTVNLVGPEHFAIAKPRDLETRSLQRAYLSIGRAQGNPVALTFVGTWTSAAELASSNPHLDVGEHGPGIHGIDPWGRPTTQYLLAPPADHPFANRLLQIDCRPGEFAFSSPPGLSFIGGFDAAELAGDSSRATSGLICQYPAAHADEIRKSLSNADFRP